jgi:hypothetical protein
VFVASVCLLGLERHIVVVTLILTFVSVIPNIVLQYVCCHSVHSTWLLSEKAPHTFVPLIYVIVGKYKT